jgi:ATP-dependent Clp protease protease subunit
MATRKHDDQTAEDRIDIVLLENHIFYLYDEIEADNIAKCIKWLTYENVDKKEKTLTIYINSGGGDLYQAFALIDVMRNSSHPIRTVGVGSIMSAAFLIFCAGTKGERYIAVNTSAMCHQFSDNIDSKYHDFKSAVKEADICNQKMIQILRDASGMSATVVKQKLLPASDVFLTAKELVELNIADHIL